ncbi:unnamed protein product [Meganyctiphanes norvegica]|uniref:Sulfotransferase domain-containing protein n=1 Tax=Meganyctiphanes norvegica TaxID=48144 RepID=A0AAV2QP95_MEGNR
MELKKKSAKRLVLPLIGVITFLLCKSKMDSVLYHDKYVIKDCVNESSFQVETKNKSHEDLKTSRNLTNIRDLPSTGQMTSLWPDDPECKRFMVGFSSGLPLVWLASFPRSGNSWTRYLIEAATGVYTNSAYNDPVMVKVGYVGEAEKAGTGRCMVTKTHRLWEQGEDHHVRTILLIRNPAKCTISHWHYHKAPGGNDFFITLDNSTYNSQAFRIWVKSNIENWRKVTEDRLLWSRKLLVVIYEELRQDPITQMHRILDFLGLQDDPSRMACLAKHLDGRVKGGQREIDPYTLEEKSAFKTAIEAVTWLAHFRNVTLPDYVEQISTGR